MNKNRLIFRILLLLVLGSAPGLMFGEPTPPPVAAAPGENPAAGGARVREFQDDDLGQVIRLLARQAKINLVVADGVHGRVSMRLEDKSAMEAIEILARANKLSLKNEKGVYYVEPATDAAEPEPESDAGKTVSEAAPGEGSDSALDVLAKPETANRIAKYKRNLFNALLREGFNGEQAIQIVAADRSGEVFASAEANR